MRRALDAWQHDPAITRIVVQGAGDKAFCAGGDIRRLTELGLAGQTQEALASGARNTSSTHSSRPIRSPTSRSSTGSSWAAASGISLHGRYRVAGERYLFAMPEVGIGFFPGCGRHLRAAAIARACGRLHRAHRRAHQARRRHDAGARHPCGERRGFRRPARGAGERRAGRGDARRRSVDPGEAPLIGGVGADRDVFRRREALGAILDCLDRGRVRTGAPYA